MRIFDKFKIGFKKSASAFTSGLRDIIVKKEIDDKTLDQIEEYLIQSDVGLIAAEEIKKIIGQEKIDPNAPHDVILVLDATSGQNVINQVEEFNKIIPLTGLIMTKLDGTAKGGILLALAKKYKLPIIALGLGEKEDDLQIFNAEKFAEAFTQIN